MNDIPEGVIAYFAISALVSLFMHWRLRRFFYRMFSLLFFRADRIWRSVCSPWRSDIIPPGCHRLVFCNTLLSHRGHDRTAHLVVASQITAVFTRGDDALKVRNGSKAGGRRFRESCRLFQTCLSPAGIMEVSVSACVNSIVRPDSQVRRYRRRTVPIVILPIDKADRRRGQLFRCRIVQTR
jgi:hypothetical protein